MKKILIPLISIFVIAVLITGFYLYNKFFKIKLPEIKTVQRSPAPPPSPPPISSKNKLFWSELYSQRDKKPNLIPASIKVTEKNLNIPTLDKKNWLYRIKISRLGDEYALSWYGRGEKWCISFSKDFNYWTTPFNLALLEKNIRDLELLKLNNGTYLALCLSQLYKKNEKKYFHFLSLITSTDGLQWNLKRKLEIKIPSDEIKKISVIRGNNNEVNILLLGENFRKFQSKDEKSFFVKNEYYSIYRMDVKNFEVVTKPVLLQAIPHRYESIGFDPIVSVLSLEDESYLITFGPAIYISDKRDSVKEVAYFKDYQIKEICRTKENTFCAFCFSIKYGYWDMYISFSKDGKEWTDPLFTGIHLFGWYGDYLFLSNEREIFTFLQHYQNPESTKDKLELKAFSIDTQRLDRDKDKDGLTDLVEERLLTNPNSKDTDGDSLYDNFDKNPIVARKKLTEIDILRSVIFDFIMQKDRLSRKEKLFLIISNDQTTQEFYYKDCTVLNLPPRRGAEYFIKFGKHGFRFLFDEINFHEDTNVAEAISVIYYSPFLFYEYRCVLRKIKDIWEFEKFEIDEWTE